MVRDELLLTAAYDSDKDRTRLFRDIQPDQFYPIYGDSSLKGFEAQSTGYLRLERGKSSLLSSSFLTEGGGDGLRDLGQYSRSLRTACARTTRTAACSSTPGRARLGAPGHRRAAGPRRLGPLRRRTASPTAKRSIVVRDRSRPDGCVLSVQPLIRYTDYEFEPFTGRLLLRKPVPSLDADPLNPVSIRVTYKIERAVPTSIPSAPTCRSARC